MIEGTGTTIRRQTGTRSLVLGSSVRIGQGCRPLQFAIVAGNVNPSMSRPFNEAVNTMIQNPGRSR